MFENNIKTILWDFDGVILDSMPIRNDGFKIVLKKYDDNIIDEFLQYHNINGGLSRYHKFRYLFSDILKKPFSENDIISLANEFSKIMLNQLSDEKLLISDSLKFIKEHYLKYEFHIVSGSDGNELRTICKNLNISKYFISICGSPTPKIELVKDILSEYQYSTKDCILIGDSINDYDAAKQNNILFYGYNNVKLKQHTKLYIEEFCI